MTIERTHFPRPVQVDLSKPVKAQLDEAIRTQSVLPEALREGEYDLTPVRPWSTHIYTLVVLSTGNGLYRVSPRVGGIGTLYSLDNQDGPTEIRGGHTFLIPEDGPKRLVAAMIEGEETMTVFDILTHTNDLEPKVHKRQIASAIRKLSKKILHRR